jgi:DNA polymerase I-like protein with 3'-5' exonuclease and polymerase domains
MIYFIGQSLFEYNDIQNATLTDCLNYCKNKKILGLDIETTRKYKKNLYSEEVFKPGLDPYLSNIIMLQIGDLENQFIIDCRNNDISILKPVLEDSQILKVGHNLKFETKHLFLKGICLKNIWDTMICEKVLYNGEKRSFSLEALMKKYLNYHSKEELDLFQNNDSVFEYEDDFENEISNLEFTEKLYVDKSIRTQFVEIGEKPFTESQIKYGATDIITPLQLQEIQSKGRIIQGELYLPTKAFEIENRFVIALGKIELRGVTIDVNGWLAMYDKNLEIYFKKKEALDNWVTSNFQKFSRTDLFSNNECLVDWQSPKSVIQFAKFLNICPKEKSKFTGKIEYTVGAKAMFRLLSNENKDLFFKGVSLDFKDKDDTQAFILNFLLFKKYQQLTTTFGKNWLRFVHPVTKKVHTNFVQILQTGRMSSTFPNLQQIPNGEEWRKLFIPSSKNKKLIATDYNSMEAVLAAEVSNVPLLQDFFINGHPIFGSDFHSFVATQMYRVIRNDSNLIINKKEHAKERNTAKSLTFKLFFGASDYTIAVDLGITPEEGTLFYNSYMDGFPGLLDNFKKTQELAYKRGWIELDPYTGMRFFYPDFLKIQELNKEAMSYFPEDYKKLSKEEQKSFKENLYKDKPFIKDLWKDWGKYRSKLARAALNYRIQGFGARLTKLAVLELEEDNYSLDEGLLLIVHDELVEEFLIENAENRSKITEKSMNLSGIIAGNKIPLYGTSAVGDYWIH